MLARLGRSRRSSEWGWRAVRDTAAESHLWRRRSSRCGRRDASYQVSLIMTHRDRAGDPSGQRAGRREAAGDAGHRRGFPTPPPIRPLPVRLRDRNGGFPRLSDGVPHGLRCQASPRHALLAESLGKPSPWVIISEIWYQIGGGLTPTATTNSPGILYSPPTR